MSETKRCYGCMEPLEDGNICPACGYSQDAPHLAAYLAPGTVLEERFTVGKLMSYNGESASYLAYDNVLLNKVIVREYMPDTLCQRSKGSSEIEPLPNVLAQYKTLLSEFVDLNKTLARMRTLNHINPAIEVFNENGTAYAVFNKFDGVKLIDYLAENAGELSWDEVKRMFPPLFTTLSLVHNAGIIHRGISPETIWVTEKGELKLTGFCIAAARTANSELTSELIGGYAAPEQYSSSSWQGTWTDVYGLCAVLYRILTGCMPVEAIGRVGNDNLIELSKLNSSIPSNVSKVIMQGLTLSGDTRLQTVTEFVTKLFEQPEFMEQKLSDTATIVIPKTVPSSDGAAAIRPSARRVFFTVGSITLVSLLAIMLVVLALLNKSGALTTADSAAGEARVLSDGADAGVPTAGYGDGGEEVLGLSPDAPIPETGEYNTNANDIIYLLPDDDGAHDVNNDAVTIAAAANNSPKQEAAKTYVMNNFVGKMYDTVKNSETYKDVLVFVPEYCYKDTVSKGQIYEQSILEGEPYIKGQELTVKVSLGPSQVSVPDYIGMKKKDYLTKLSSLGIKYDERPFETSDVMGGYICKTSIEVGKMVNVEDGETIIVYVAVNPSSTSIRN